MPCFPPPSPLCAPTPSPGPATSANATGISALGQTVLALAHRRSTHHPGPQKALALNNASIIHMDYPIGRSPGDKIVSLLIHRNDHINLKESRCSFSFHPGAHQIQLTQNLVLIGHVGLLGSADNFHDEQPHCHPSTLFLMQHIPGKGDHITQ